PPPSPPALAQALQSPPKSPAPDGPGETSHGPKYSRYRYAPPGRDESSATYPGETPRYPSAQSSPEGAASYQPSATTSSNMHICGYGYDRGHLWCQIAGRDR